MEIGMMKINTFLVLWTLLFSNSVMATTNVSLGLLDEGTTIPLNTSNDLAYFDHSLVEYCINYNFSLASTSDVTINLLQNGYHLNDTTVNLFDTTSFKKIKQPIININYLFDDMRYPGILTIDYISTLSSGNYDLMITGNKYYDITGNISIVPEPETYALMLLGLGLINMVYNSRKKAKI